MSNLYGTVRPSNLNIDTDVEMFYFYRPTRSTDDDEFLNGFKRLDTVNLVPCVKDSEGETSELNDILGLYELRLPLDIFNKKGFYSIYIRPKEIEATLTDVSVLAAYPDVKGVIVNVSGFDGITDLTGYRIDYIDDSGDRTNISRIITSCNRCEPVLVTVADSYPKTTRYRLVDTATNLMFCTVTPSSASSFKPNVTPFIGVPGGKVVISNTKFDPKLVEIEMVDHDIDTLTYMVEGDQVRNRDTAIITTYNDEHEIYKQQDYYTVKDSYGNALRDVKRNREIIDGSQSYDNVVNTK